MHIVKHWDIGNGIVRNLRTVLGGPMPISPEVLEEAQYNQEAAPLPHQFPLTKS